MHEMSLCESIINALEVQAKQQGFSHVKGVWLEIGALAAIDIDAMRFSFDVVAKNTLADQAALTIHTVSGQGLCRLCGAQSQLIHRYDACASCGEYNLQVTDGEQMKIKEIEVV